MAKADDRLKQLVEYAYYKVPYFNYAVNNKDIDIGSFGERTGLSDLPIFSKDTIIEYGYANFLSSDFMDAENHIVVSPRIRIERTSGTTRDSMEIPWEHSDYIGSIKYHWQYRKKHGNITPLSVNVSAINMPLSETVRIQNNNIYFNVNNLSDECVMKLFEIFETMRPEWIYTFGSILYVLLRKIEKLGLKLPPSIRYIEVVGEPFLEHYKQYIEQFTGMRVHDAYGCTETNGIAYTCKNGHFHIMNENVAVETVDKETALPYGSTGYICVTGLFNRVMPFIRYRLNDIGELHKGEECDCGEKADYLTIHTTRLPKVLYLDDESIFRECCLFFAIDNIFAIRCPDRNAIPFCMQYHGVHTYEIAFHISAHEKYGVDRLNALILNIMQSYGFEDIAFVISFRKLQKKEINGFLELKDE